MPSRRSITVRGLAIALGAVLVLAGCTSVITASGSPSLAPSTASPSPTTSKIAFSDCSKLFNISSLDLPAKRTKNLQILCGKLAVPLDYNDPASRKINIEVLKLHDSTQSKKIGDLLMNPGGPGVPGLTLPLDLLSGLSDSIVDNFDLIGFDPRGVELSSPIACISDETKDALIAANPDVRTTTGFTEAQTQQSAVAEGCSAKYGASLADYNTLFTAMDMEQIRIALGDPQLNYLGFSYGTELGGVYAHLYPKTIRVAVLDGAVDPLTDSLTSSANQLQGFESAFDDFAADCKTRASCAVLGNPRQVVYQLVAKADVTPIKSAKAGETRAATGGDILYGVLSALYTTTTWPTLGDALIQAQKGDSQGLLALSDSYNERQDNGAFTNSIDATTTIGCNDSPLGPTDATISATAATWATQYPMFGLWSAGSLFTCQAWQVNRTVPPLPTAVGSAPILVVGGTHDPATPYQGAVNLAKTLTTGQVLTWQGFGHTAYGRGSDCIDNAVNTYLLTAQMPPGGHRLPDVSEPHLHVDPPPGEPAAIALVLHGGRASSRAAVRPWSVPAARMLPFARALNRAGAADGLVVARLRYRERGWNGTTQSPVPDARGAIAELARRFPGLPLGLVGHSMGGRTALHVADEPSVCSVVGLAPWIEPGDPIDALRGRFVLLAHGDADRVTDPAASAAFAEQLRPIAKSSTYVRVEHGKHAMLGRAHVWHELAALFTTGALFGKTMNGTGDAAIANVVMKALEGQPTLAL